MNGKIGLVAHRVILGVVLGLLAIPLSAYVFLYGNMLADYVAGGNAEFVGLRIYLITALSMAAPALLVILPAALMIDGLRSRDAVVIGVIGALILVVVTAIGEVVFTMTLIVEMVALIILAWLSFKLGKKLRTSILSRKS